MSTMDNIDETVKPRAWAWRNEPNGEEVYSGWDSPRPTYASEPLYDREALQRYAKIVSEDAVNKIRLELMAMHEESKSDHNYWAYALVKLFNHTS